MPNSQRFGSAIEDERTDEDRQAEALGRMVSAIAHDLKNIFMPIILNGELAQREVRDPDKCAVLLERVLAAARQGSALVHRLVRFSEGKPADRSRRRISPILAEALDMIEATLPADIEVQRDLLSERDVSYVDAAQIHELAMNLTTNAVDAMQDRGGVVLVRVHPIDLSERRTVSRGTVGPGAYLELVVGDDGCGIDPDVREQVFDPFFTTKRSGQGNGLGLAVTLGVIRRHGGGIDIESEPGVGTTVRVFLPRLNEAPDDEKEPSSRMGTIAARRVLVVDDKPEIARDLGQALEHLGQQVSVFTDSTQAFDQFSQRPNAFDLVMTDYDMPEIDGLELATRIHALRSGIPVVIFTGVCSLIDVERAASAGIVGVVQKPLEVAEVIDILRKTERTSSSEED